MLSSLQIAPGLLAGTRRDAPSLLRRRKADACTSRLRKTDGDGLLGRSRAVLAATDVVNLFSDKFSSYGRGRFTRAHRLARALDGSLFRHVGPP
jgi:hypothetical protein